MLELVKNAIRQNVQKGKAATQITLDDDCIVKDHKPDVVKIIHTRGSLSFDEVKVSSQTVWVSGQLKFTVLYHTEDNRLDTLSDSVNFGEKIYMENATEEDQVRIGGQLEDLNISAINSRKLAVRAVLALQAASEQQVEEELVSALRSDDMVQQRTVKRPMLLLVTSKRDLMRIHKELTLPGASPNIGKIIDSHVDIRKKEIVPVNDRIQIQAEAHVCVLYSSEEGQLEWYESVVPFEGMLDDEQEGTKPLYWIVSQLIDQELEAVGDYDGEMRSLSLDLTFTVEIRVWNEEEVSILSDAYSLQKTLIPQTTQMCARRLLVKNEAKLRVSQQMRLSAEQERILQLCAYEGSVTVDQTEMVEHGLRVEGVLSVHILYATTDDHCPLAHTFEQIPFSQIIDVPGLYPDMQGVTYELDPGIDQLTVSLLDNERYEVKATLSLAALVLAGECFQKIVDITEEPLDEKVLADQPGIVGYMAKEGETLWEIAKRFHTTEGEIVSTNNLKSSDIRQGEKLLIVKNVG